jgi:ABC-2 type transport system permease protein
MSSSVLPTEHATTGDSAAVASHLARRSILMITRVPSAFLPSLIMPVFFIVAFTGVYASIVLVPGFPTDNIDSWFVPLAAVQGAVFSGVTVGGGVVRDIETRFYDRLLLAPGSRAGILVGPILAGIAGPLLGAIGRAQPTVTVTLVIGLLLGARLPGGLLGLVVFYLICTGVALVAGAWALGLSYRFQNQQAAAPGQFGFQILVFLSASQVPLSMMTGWLHTVAKYNPFTYILEAARAGFVGEITWSAVWAGFMWDAILSVLTIWFARRQIRRLIP